MAKKTREKKPESNSAELYHGSGKSPLEIQKHSTEHVMAMAIMRLWPKAQRGVGPAIEDGFYQDFFLEGYSVKPEDFPKIEAEMERIRREKLVFEKSEKSIDEALRTEKERGQGFKTMLIKDLAELGEKKVTYYTTGEYVDLCKGPHVEDTSQIGFYKLDRVAGAYWRGDEKNPMLQRIYGLCFATKEELDNYVRLREEAGKRDHRKIGKELDLFTFSDLVGSGFPLYTPKGALVRRLLNEYVESLQVQEGYQQVWTPQVAKAELFKTSGHYDKYKDDMFKVMSHYSEEEMFLKPMNCPQHTQIYAAKPRSYKDLPLRMTDFAMLYRDEKPGELSGLARVRSFSQDDCHIFCREDQVDEEIDKALIMIKEVMKTFDFKYRYRLSTRDPAHPEKYLGRPEIWDKVEKWAVSIMERNKIEYYPGVGEAAFYAPKMDLMATDALGREWQLSTVQIDYVMPERFGLIYAAPDGSLAQPVMIHRAILGSAERFMMIILEHYAGALPLWLAPIQVRIIPISDKFSGYGRKVTDMIKNRNIRVELDERAETMQAKIRDGQLQKIPYMLIVGGREEEAGSVSVRLRTEDDLGQMSVEAAIKRIETSVASKSIL